MRGSTTISQYSNIAKYYQIVKKTILDRFSYGPGLQILTDHRIIPVVSAQSLDSIVAYWFFSPFCGANLLQHRLILPQNLENRAFRSSGSADMIQLFS